VNPAYRGPWKARQIPNPDFYEETAPATFLPATGIGFELWTMQGGILFDNILITDDERVASDFAAETWTVKYDIERLNLELELQAKGISDEPAIENDISSPDRRPSVLELLNTVKFIRRQMQRFIQLAISDPKSAIFKYPFITLNTVFITVLATYLVGIMISWLIGRTTPRVAVQKKEEAAHGATVQQVQKSGKVLEVEDLTSRSPTGDHSPSRLPLRRVPSRPSSPSQSQIPRPASPVRNLKFNKLYESRSKSFIDD
jgi:calnexin